MNQLARNQMQSEVQMGVRRLSYEAFKRKAREHQVLAWALVVISSVRVKGSFP